MRPESPLRGGMPSPSLSLFGGPVLGYGSDRIALSPYQGALLGFLATEGGRGVSVARLVDTLWEPLRPGVAKHRLSQLVHTVNRKSEDGLLIAKSAERYGLSAHVVTDLDALLEGLAQGQLEEAAEIFSRGFLSGLSKTPTDTFADWLDAMRLKLRASIRETAAARWTELTREGRWHQASGPAQVLLSLDPSDEKALQMVIRARAMSGRVKEAEAVYSSFAERAESTAGAWTPSNETRALFDRVKALDPGPYHRLEQPRAEADPRPILVGRADELAALSAAARSVAGSGLRIVVVKGEGGMGKTRLVEESLAGVALDGVRVLRGQSSEFERDIPLNPILEAFMEPEIGAHIQKLEDPWRLVLLALMPEFHHGPAPLPELPYIQPGSIPRRLFEAIRQLFVGVARDAPTIVFIDDFQWVDETSVAALEYLLRRWESEPLVLVLSVRTESLVAGGAVDRFLTDKESDDEAREFLLDELSMEAAQDLVREVARTPISATEGEEIATLGGFNPFFIIELTLEFEEGRRLPRPDLGDLIPLPFLIRQVLDQRLSQLEPDSEHALNTLSVFGRAARGHELAKLSKLTQEACVEALEQLQGFRLVKWTDHGFQVRHELIRQAVYSRLSQARKAWMHGEVARYLEQTDSADSVGELALHYGGAEENSKALGYALEAASQAEAAGAVPEALRFLRIGRQSTEDPSQSAELIGRTAHLNYLHRDFEQAAPLLGLAADRFRQLGRIREALMAELEHLDILSQREALPTRDFLRQLQDLKQTALRQDFWEVAAKAMDTEVRLLDRAEEIEGVRRVVSEAEGLLGGMSPRAECSLLGIVAFNLYYGSPTRALEAARRGLLLAQEHGLIDEVLKSSIRLIVVMLHQGLLETREGEVAIEVAESLARRSGDLYSRFNLRSWSGASGQRRSSTRSPRRTGPGCVPPTASSGCTARSNAGSRPPAPSRTGPAPSGSSRPSHSGPHTSGATGVTSTSHSSRNRRSPKQPSRRRGASSAFTHKSGLDPIFTSIKVCGTSISGSMTAL